MSSGAGISEETSKTQPQTGRRLMMGAVVLLAGAVVILIAGVVLMQGEIASLRSTLEEFKPPEDGVTESQNKAQIFKLAKRGIARVQDTREKRGVFSPARQAKAKCEQITIPFCKNMPYTMAQFPNLLNHQTQDEAKAAIAASNFGQLLESGCSPDAGPLLCSALAPPCNGTQKPVLPCKGLCKRAMKGCRNQMKKFRITLTSAMRCRRLPKEGASECFDGSWPKNTLATGCQPMDLNMCVGHTKTSSPGKAQFPNYFGHVTQQDARTAFFTRFMPLVPTMARKECSSMLDFLCPMYAPPCAGSKPPLPPCRELCLQAKSKCKRAIKHLTKSNGFRWPTDLKCKTFPRRAEAACYMGTSVATTAETATTTGMAVTRSPPLVSLPGKCQVITIPMCKTVPHNMTEFPNFFRHNTQKEAALEVNQFSPLVEMNCSADLAFFLCSMYTPLCSSLDSPPPPCRGLCSRVRSGCLPVLLKFGFKWPDSMACEKFPDTLCIDRPNMAAVTTQPPPPTKGTCEPLAVPTCGSLHYNSTWVPNSFKHKTQDEAARKISKFEPLIQANCSSELTFFLCSLYAPRCSPYKAVPCKELCVRVRRSCLPRMRELRIKWPMSCSKLRTKAESSQCIGGPPSTEITKPIKPTKSTVSIAGRCEALTIPLCNGRLNYNMTRFPNILSHRTQEEAALEVHQFFPLVKIACSDDLAPFLCSIYAPPCKGPRKPCRELCNRARRGCLPLMQRFGFNWPDSMACDRFPSSGNGTECVDPQSTATKATTGGQ